MKMSSEIYEGEETFNRINNTALLSTAAIVFFYSVVMWTPLKTNPSSYWDTIITSRFQVVSNTNFVIMSITPSIQSVAELSKPVEPPAVEIPQAWIAKVLPSWVLFLGHPSHLWPCPRTLSLYEILKIIT
jgi:hypothetical protein